MARDDSDGTTLKSVTQHLIAALEAVDDSRGRYHIRQALQLLDAKRDGSCADEWSGDWDGIDGSSGADGGYGDEST